MVEPGEQSPEGARVECGGDRGGPGVDAAGWLDELQSAGGGGVGEVWKAGERGGVLGVDEFD